MNTDLTSDEKEAIRKYFLSLIIIPGSILSVILLAKKKYFSYFFSPLTVFFFYKVVFSISSQSRLQRTEEIELRYDKFSAFQSHDLVLG